jgi:dethiobiotin synthetase
MNGLFITGTDTEVGKTHVAAGLLHLLAQDGARTAGLKPVAAGLSEVGGRWVNEDVDTLRAASSLPLSDAEVGPYQFRAACAPHIAAAQEGRTIDRSTLLAAAHGLAARCDWLVVEGVGGWRVPLAPGWDSAALAADLGLPVVLVVGLRLGCISHALLTAESVRARGLPLVGWVANRIDPAMLHANDNLATLHQTLRDEHGIGCLGVVPWLSPPSPAAVAVHLDRPALMAALMAAPKATPKAAPSLP